MKKVLLKTFAVAGCLSLLASVPAFAGWEKTDDGSLYYVNADGQMVENQWINIGGTYYYAGNGGAILKNTTTPDGYYVDSNGVWDQSIAQVQGETEGQSQQLEVLDELKPALWEAVKAEAKKELKYKNTAMFPEWNDEGTRSPEEMVLITQSMKEVNQIMSTYVGIVRSDLRLKRAWDRLDIIYEETESLFKRSVASREICELRNMVNVGYLIMRQAMERKESRGLHYTIDYPHAKK